MAEPLMPNNALDDDPYPFESDDDIEIRELDLESLDAVAEARITVSDLAHVAESWRYGHVIVDEAQDLTPMQWRMVMRRVRGQALTIVGDLAQRSLAGPALEEARRDGWDALLPRELRSVHRQDLTVNYRSPAEIHELAVAVLAEFAPSVAPSQAIRTSGSAPEFFAVETLADDLQARADAMLATVGGQVAVIAADPSGIELLLDTQQLSDDGGRLRLITPNQSKGLEFDGVVLVEPDAIWREGDGAAELYIALTRATQRLSVVHALPLPKILQAGA